MRLEIYCLIHKMPYRTIPYGTGAKFGWDFVRARYPRIGSYGRTVYRAVGFCWVILLVGMCGVRFLGAEGFFLFFLIVLEIWGRCGVGVVYFV